MATYHINPKTGNPGRCRAELGNCPFGGAEEHYDSVESAAKAYEERMENIELFLHYSAVPVTAKTRVLTTYSHLQEPDEEASPGFITRGRMVAMLHGDVPVQDGTRLVIENGTVAEAKRNEVTGELLWQVVDNREFFDTKDIQSIHGTNLVFSMLSWGGRFEIGGEPPRLPAKELAYRYPNERDYQLEVQQLREKRATDAQELQAALADHVAERWHGRPQSEYMAITHELEQRLGEPQLLGRQLWGWR